jgi:hypothetical protein
MFMEILNSVYGSNTEERSGIKECNDKDRSEFFKKKFLPHMFPELSGVAVDPKRGSFIVYLFFLLLLFYPLSLFLLLVCFCLM